MVFVLTLEPDMLALGTEGLLLIEIAFLGGLGRKLLLVLLVVVVLLASSSSAWLSGAGGSRGGRELGVWSIKVGVWGLFTCGAGSIFSCRYWEFGDVCVGARGKRKTNKD